MLRNKKKILFINWGTPDKEYTFKAANKKGLDIYLATLNNYPKWIDKYVPNSRIIIANTYDSTSLINSVITFMNDTKIIFDGITTFFEMNIIPTADLAEVLGLPFIKSSSAKKSSANKLLMRFYCAKNNIRSPKFTSFSSISEGLKKLESFSSPAVIKAVHSGHSYGVMKIEGKTKQLLKEDFINKYNLATQQLNSNFDEWMRYSTINKEHFILEEYFEGPVFSVDGIVQDNEIKVSILTEYEVTQGPHLLQKATIIPSTFTSKTINKCKREVFKIITALEFDNCGFHVEMRLTKNGPMLLEAACRPPGGKILDAYNYIYHVDIAGLYLDINLGKKIKRIDVEHSRYLIIEAKYASENGFVSEISDNADSDISNFKLFYSCKKGDYVGYIFGIPSTYLYFQIIANTREELNIQRKKIKTKLVVIKKKVWKIRFFELLILISKVTPKFIKKSIIGHKVKEIFK